MYYSEIVRHRFENGENVEDIEADLSLTAIIPWSVANQHIHFSPLAKDHKSLLKDGRK